MLSDFVEYLQNKRIIGYSGTIGNMNALGHLFNFRRTFSHSASEITSDFLASEICLQRVKRFLLKRMKLHWYEVLSVGYIVVGRLIVGRHWQIYKKLFRSLLTGISELS